MCFGSAGLDPTLEGLSSNGLEEQLLLSTEPLAAAAEGSTLSDNNDVEQENEVRERVDLASRAGVVSTRVGVVREHLRSAVFRERAERNLPHREVHLTRSNAWDR